MQSNQISSSFEFDALIYCAAVSSFIECSKDIEKSLAVNVDTPISLATLCDERGSALFLSSSAVFSGHQEFNLLTTHNQAQFMENKN